MRKKPCMMSKILIILSILAIAQFLPSVVKADNYNASMTFSETGQSMWAAGPAYTVNYSKFLGFSWGPTTEGFSIGPGDISLGPIDFGSYLIAGSATTSGKLGVDAGVKINGGSVNVTYPVGVTLNYPSPIKAVPGATFTISSSFTPQAGATMSTFFPTITPFANLEAALSMKIGAEVDFVTCLTGCNGNNTSNILNLSLGPYTYDLLDWLAGKLGIPFPVEPGKSATYHIPNNYGDVKVTIPNDLNTTDTLSGNNLVSQTDPTKGQFLDAELNLMKLGELLPPPLDAAFLAFNELNYGGVSFAGASFNWDLIDITAGVISRILQSFEFDPDLRVDLYTKTGFDLASFDVGSSDTVTLPLNVSDFLSNGGLELSPVFSLDNSFTNNTSLGFDPDFQISALTFEGKLPDLPIIGSQSKTIGPLYNPPPWIAGGLTEGIYSNTFPLSFNPKTTDPFTVDVVPEPITLILFGSGLIGVAAYGRKKFFKK